MNNNFEDLIQNISHTHDVLQNSAAKAVNQYLSMRNWLVGYYIVEYEQHGGDRAKYGEGLIKEMSVKLTARGLKGFSISALKTHRNFYLMYPQIRHIVIGELQKADIQIKILSDIGKSAKGQSVIGFSDDSLSPKLLLSKLTYTHFIELIRINDPLQRLFYETETIKNNWSVRELKRAIDTSLALRTTLSTNKEGIIARIKNLKPIDPVEIIKNPYILEFLGLEEKPEFSESDLEQSIIGHLQQFLVELGTAFCFKIFA
jgi:predicted nuclease of restriction endonuclease-like (RecB) superfamily